MIRKRLTKCYKSNQEMQIKIEKDVIRAREGRAIEWEPIVSVELLELRQDKYYTLI